MGALCPVCTNNLGIVWGRHADAEKIHRLSHACRASSQEDLLQLRIVASELLVRLAQLLSFSARVQDRRMVAAAERLADLGQALLRKLLGEGHGDLARPRY